MLDCLGRLRDSEHHLHVTSPAESSVSCLVFLREGGNEEEKSESMTCGA